MKITLAQLNPTIGDLDGNILKIKQSLDIAQKHQSELIVFPELFLTGYPPRDLLLKPWFLDAVCKKIDQLISLSLAHPDIGILVGAPSRTHKKTGCGLYNSALLIDKGQVIFTQHKSLLPSYDVFDETRYFDPAPAISSFLYKGEHLGISICEDAWNDDNYTRHQSRYTSNPMAHLAKNGATVLINLSASPYRLDVQTTRHDLFQRHSQTHQCPCLVVNQVGGNDELVFDGASMVFNACGDLVNFLPVFKESLSTIDLKKNVGIASEFAPDSAKKNSAGSTATSLNPIQYHAPPIVEHVYLALVLGIKDYMHKCGFSKAVIGLSGGIDSAVTLCLARAALGSENVLAVAMPSPYSSEASLADARALAKNADIELVEISITDIFSHYLETLAPHFLGLAPDVTEENIQARIRGTLLMAFSNKMGSMVLSTGNKSEMAVGYCTLYGDMSGGLSVLADIPKTMVVSLANYMTMSERGLIPQSIIDKPPSAELKHDQKDSDTLPDYETLDAILYQLIEEKSSPQDIINMGYNKDIVMWVVSAVRNNEYKRKQAAPGLKVTGQAFGMGRRIPIAMKISGT